MQQTMDQRFEFMQQQMSSGFDALSKRMDGFMVWSFSTSVATAGMVIGALNVWL